MVSNTFFGEEKIFFSKYFQGRGALARALSYCRKIGEYNAGAIPVYYGFQIIELRDGRYYVEVWKRNEFGKFVGMNARKTYKKKKR